jgi:hypothetical protein
MRTALALAVAIAILAAGLMHAQAPARTARASSYSAPRTPWGDPDLQGIYTNSNESGTPLARPPEFAGKKPEDVTPEEMARLAKERAARIEKTAQIIGATEDNNTGAGPTHWYENYNPRNSRPWMVLDAPDYQVPPTHRRRATAPRRCVPPVAAEMATTSARSADRRSSRRTSAASAAACRAR